MRVHRLRLSKIRSLGIVASAALLLTAMEAATADASLMSQTPWTTTRQVALANPGPLYMAWIDPHANDELTLAYSTDGGFHFSTGFHPLGPGNSNSAPALAVFNNKLWMAWTGTDSNNTLNLAYSSNGTTWTQESHPLGRNNSPDGPALAEHAGRLYYAWRGTDSKGTINIASSADGVNWTAPAQPGGNTSTNAPALFDAPSFSGLPASLWMAWIGTDTNHTISVAQTTDGVHLFNQRSLGVGSNHQPSVSLADGVGAGLIIAYTAHDDNLAAIPYSDQSFIPKPTELPVGPIIEAPTAGLDAGDVYAWVNRADQIWVMSCNDGPPPAGQPNIGAPFC